MPPPRPDSTAEVTRPLGPPPRPAPDATISAAAPLPSFDAAVPPPADPSMPSAPPPPPSRFPVAGPSETDADRDYRHRLWWGLRAMFALGAVNFVAFVLLTLFPDSELFGERALGPVGKGLMAVTALAFTFSAAWLWRRPGLSVTTLRRTEMVVLWLANACLVLWYYGRITAPVELFESNPAHARVAILLGGLHAILVWFFGIIVHGVLTPTTPRQSLVWGGLTVLIACAPVVVAGMQYEAVRETWPTLLAGNVSAIGTLTGILAYTSYRMTALQKEASEARRELRELGQYRLVRRLGVGGMGEVHLAEHRLLKRPCAVKLIRPDRAGTAAYLARFEREVQATAALRHPNTVEIYDYGRHADGTFYYVMEYLEGMSLEDVAERDHRLPPGRVVHLMRQLCGALRAAHAAGLVHRDIKPSNVMVGSGSGGVYDRVKLLDFGLARGLPDSGADARLTQEGLVVGTPAYMSPEQASGAAQVDGRCDLYSVGAMAYHLLTGMPPFPRAGVMDILVAHIRDEPERPTSVHPHVPPDLEEVVLRCLAKKPADRYPDAAALDAALAACRCAHAWTEEASAAWWAAAKRAEELKRKPADALSLS